MIALALALGLTPPMAECGQRLLSACRSWLGDKGECRIEQTSDRLTLHTAPNSGSYAGIHPSTAKNAEGWGVKSLDQDGPYSGTMTCERSKGGRAAWFRAESDRCISPLRDALDACLAAK